MGSPLYYWFYALGLLKLLEATSNRGGFMMKIKEMLEWQFLSGLVIATNGGSCSSPNIYGVEFALHQYAE